MKKIIVVILGVGLMLAYVWMRAVNNRLAEEVQKLDQRTEILAEKLEREHIELSNKLLCANLEPRARSLGLCYPWEAHGAN